MNTSERDAVRLLLLRASLDEAVRERFVAAYSGTGNAMEALRAAADEDRWWELAPADDRRRLSQIAFGRESSADARRTASARLEELRSEEDNRRALIEAVGVVGTGERLTAQQRREEAASGDDSHSRTLHAPRSWNSLAAAGAALFGTGLAIGLLLTHGAQEPEASVDRMAESSTQAILRLSVQADTWLASGAAGDPIHPAAPEIADLLPGRYVGNLAGVDFWATKSKTGDYCVVSQRRSASATYDTCVMTADYDPGGLTVISDEAQLHWAGHRLTLSLVRTAGV